MPFSPERQFKESSTYTPSPVRHAMTISSQQQEDVNTSRQRDSAGSETCIQGSRPAKRARVALACQRCKSRKQKCGGQTPTCDNCESFNAECRYIKLAKPASQNPIQDYTSREDRVAELESILMREGITEEGHGQWHRKRGARMSDCFDQIQLGTQESQPKFTKSSKQLDSIKQNGSNDGWESRVKDTDVNGVVDILQDLSLEASGGYIGASSSITMSRMVGSLVRSNESPSLMKNGPLSGEHLSSKSASDNMSSSENFIETGDVEQEVADRLIKRYIEHISTRWPIIHSESIRTLHLRRDCLDLPYEKGVLHLVYAIGGRFLETTGQTGAFFAERHHASGMQYLEEIMQYHNASTVQILLLLAMYSLRAPKGPGAWTYIGLAMRTCIDIGFHRRLPGKRSSVFDMQMRRRIFWTCYCLDRQVSIVLGRPFAISDRDIDRELPLDVDECCQDVSVLEAAHQASKSLTQNGTTLRSTSMNCFIHICRLRRIESQIQQSIYRVDQPPGTQESKVEMYIKAA